MKRFFTIAVALLAAAGFGLAVSAASSGKKYVGGQRETRTVTVSNFSGIDASMGVDVVYTPSSSVSATVEAPSEIMPYVKVNQLGEMLNITISKEGNVGRGKNARVKVRFSAPVVNTYILSTGAEVKVKGAVDAGNRDMTIKASTGSELDIASVVCKDLVINADTGAEVDIDMVNANSVSAKANTGAEIDLSGKASSVDFKADTAGEIDADKLVASSGVAVANTSGTIECSVSGKFTNRTSTGGTVRNR